MGEQTTILNGLRWVINILIIVIGFFISTKLSAIDKTYGDLEGRVRRLELFQARELEVNRQILSKLDQIIDKQNTWEKNIADFYYLNPDLQKPDIGK